MTVFLKFQVVQTGQVLQGPNGQHIVVHAVPQQPVQIATPSNPPIQQLQVLPMSTLQVSIPSQPYSNYLL